MRTFALGLVFVISGCSSAQDDATTTAGGATNNAGGQGGGNASGGNASGGQANSGGSSLGTSGSGGSALSTTGGTAPTTGGTSATGGTGTAGTGGTDPVPPQTVLPCDSLAAVGEWENITPPQIQPLQGDDMTNRFVVDPVHSGTVYLGTNHLGIWKTTDCGANWFNPAGQDGPKCGWDNKTCAEALQSGLQWTFAIDPVEPEVLYANSGYGQYGSGLYKSTNAGVDWDEIWPKNSGIDGVNGFVGYVAVDPSQHQHLLVSFHEAPNLAESMDGGATWKLIEWAGDGIWLLDSTTWLSPRDGGLWRSSDSGVNWAKVSDANSESHSGGFLYRATNGTYYLGAQPGVVRSTDGLNWSVVPNSGNLVKAVVGDGKHLYASSGAVPWHLDAPIEPYLTSDETDGTSWSLMPSPKMDPGADDMHYDAGHHILYSSNCQGGFWRVRTE